MDESVILTNVTKKYKMYHTTAERLYDLILPKSFGEDFYALQDINFTAKRGDVIGILGINGSGKSTLSNIISGIVPPTDGTVKTIGETSIIAVNAGLKNDLTGLENIELKCLMLGFTKKQINEMKEDIIEFAELEKFIDQPVKNYSSGMKSRLGFSISVTVDPDILVIDEALSVGDKAFSEKSLSKMHEFKDKGKTIFFISHSLGQMKEFCEKSIWLEYGRLKAEGNIEEIIPVYEEFLQDFKKMSKKEKAEYREKVVNQNSILRK